MSSFVTLTLASVVVPPQSVPDSGATAFLAGLGILALGVASRFFKNRKK